MDLNTIGFDVPPQKGVVSSLLYQKQDHPTITAVLLVEYRRLNYSKYLISLDEFSKKT